MSDMLLIKNKLEFASTERNLTSQNNEENFADKFNLVPFCSNENQKNVFTFINWLISLNIIFSHII